MKREPEPFWRLYGRALAEFALGHREEADAALNELIEMGIDSSRTTR